MQLIAAVDKHWAIGKNGQMLAVIPADQKLFRQETIGKVVVMGQKPWNLFQEDVLWRAGPTLC